MCRYLDLRLFLNVGQCSKVAEGDYTFKTRIPVATALTVPHERPTITAVAVTYTPSWLEKTWSATCH